MTKEIGTLKELNVKPGDVVQVVGGKSWEIVGIDERGNYLVNDPPANYLSRTLPFRIFFLAPEPKATPPKLWKDMTPEEKGALLLARVEGAVIQCKAYGSDWMDKDFSNNKFNPDHTYRVKPEPVVETVALCWKKGLAMGQIGTIDLIDGKPDCNSVKMEEI